MNDTLAIKDLAPATIGGTQLPGSARNFNRVASPAGAAWRRSLHISSVSPTDFKVQHSTSKSGQIRSSVSCDQSLARLDAQSNVTKTSQVYVQLTLVRDPDVTLAEAQVCRNTLLGALTESTGALFDALFAQEQ